jgi:hypothetical protein
MLLFTFFIFILAPNLTKAAVLADAAEIPYQINNSDHIVIGTVSGINVYYNYTIATITVNDWLYNPLPDKIIKVRTEIGTNVNTEDQPVFTMNESALLMLLDQDRLFIDEDIDKQKDIDKQQFIVSVGFVGKHPISDRDAVINVLKAQGKWNGENLTGNKTNETEPKFSSSANISQDIPSKSTALDINDPSLQRAPLPDFGPQTFKNLKTDPDVIAIRGQMPQFSTQAERRNWLGKLDEIRILADDDLSPYAYPKGPVLGHGFGENGTFEVILYKGMNVTDNQIDEIYNVINKIGNKLNIQDVPVVFFKRDFIQDAILTEDSGAIDEKSNLSHLKQTMEN